MSFSVPTSPAMPRSTKAQPVTPQRHQVRSLYRSPFSPSRSPYTPLSLRSLDSTASSTLTTPDNLGSGCKKRATFSAGSPEVARNGNFTQDKSLADIAENWRNRANENGIKVSFASQGDPHFVADESSNMSMSESVNDSSMISNEEAFLAAPFLSSTHRRLNSLPITNRPRAQSHASLSSVRIHPLSPLTSRTANSLQMTSPSQPRPSVSSLSHQQNLMSTPPPNRNLLRQLKLKGSLTDPAQPRRREAFGLVSSPSNNVGHRNTNMSLTLEPDSSLFNIDENELEYEYDQQLADDSFSQNLQAFQANNFGYPTFTQHHQHAPSNVFGQASFADPFHPMDGINGLTNGHRLNGLLDGVEHHFHANRLQNLQEHYYDDSHHPNHIFYNARPQHQFNDNGSHSYSTPSFVPVSQPSALPFQQSILHQSTSALEQKIFSSESKPYTASESAPSDCSVCLASNPASLAILQPCRHPLCSACLTSALNIVGEKDMQCAVCKESVADFKLVAGTNKIQPSGATAHVLKGHQATETVQTSEKVDTSPDSSGECFMDPTCSAPSDSSKILDYESVGDLESVFDLNFDFGQLRASTPKLEQERNDNVVLRIDNVPWDITPLQITNWLQQPVERVYVLLDGKGKTLSHAYVEVKSAVIAGAILRGEGLSSGSNAKKERGSVLGKGRRARGVTITRSGQQELMSDLFPHWRGGFDGSRPSLAGLEGDRIIAALEGGLMTEHEISGLLHLIREPDSHFLKVPLLPFYSLISILSKFPADVDSRVFWSASVRDMLFDTSFTALQTLLSRVQKAKEISKVPSQAEEYSTDLVIDLLHTALACKAFTAYQVGRLMAFAQTSSLPIPVSENDISGISDPSILPPLNVPSPLKTPPNQDISNNPFIHHDLPCHNESQAHKRDGSLDDLAKEFGVDAHVVQALAQRLAMLC